MTLPQAQATHREHAVYRGEMLPLNALVGLGRWLFEQLLTKEER